MSLTRRQWLARASAALLPLATPACKTGGGAAAATATTKPNALPVWTRCVSLRVLQEQLLAHCPGGDCADHPALTLGGLTRLDGFVAAPNQQDLVLLGAVQAGQAPLHTSDWVVALRPATHRYLDEQHRYTPPGVSIDARPESVQQLKAFDFSALNSQGSQGSEALLAWARLCATPQDLRIIGLPRESSHFLRTVAVADEEMKSYVDATHKLEGLQTPSSLLLAQFRQALAKGKTPDMRSAFRMSRYEVGRKFEALCEAVRALSLQAAMAQATDEERATAAGHLAALGAHFHEQGHRAQACSATEQAADLYRQVAQANPLAFTPDLAGSLNNLGGCFSALGRREEALAAAVEASDLRRQLAQDNPQAFTPDLAASLNNLGNMLSALGRREEALAAAVEACRLLLNARADNPAEWVSHVHQAVQRLQTPSHVRNLLIPMLAGLTDRREIAHDGAAAALFLGLQAELAAMVWRMSMAWCDSDPGLVDEALPTVVAVLQSPDLARWLADLAQDSPLKQDLAKCRADLKAADDELAAVLARVRGGAGGGAAGKPGGSRVGEAGAALDAEAKRLALAQLQADALADAQDKRLKFHQAQQRVMAEDPAYRAAHQVPTAQGLRVQAAALAPGLQGKAGLAVGDAVLFWLALQGENGGEHEAAGWLLFADGRPSRLLALPGLLAVALTMAQYQPVGNRQAATRLRRGMADIGQVAAAARPLVFAALLQDTQSLFWQPLAAALGGHAVGTLHVCAHGPLHQLALGLGADADPAVAGKISRVVAWPGMPYLRLAADTAPGPAAAGQQTPQAWQIGHDCAWLGEQPLPMAAVEARLTASLLAAQQQAHLHLDGAAALQPAGAGLVACCHGSQIGRAHV